MGRMCGKANEPPCSRGRMKDVRTELAGIRVKMDNQYKGGYRLKVIAKHMKTR